MANVEEVLEMGNKTLLEEVEEFLHVTGMPPSRFGRNCMRDPTLVFHMRDGREPRYQTAEKIRQYMTGFVK